MPEKEFPPFLLTGKEVAQRLKVSPSAAYALIRSGDLPSLRIGRSVRVRIEDLDAFILSRLSGNFFASELFRQAAQNSVPTTEPRRQS